MEAVTLQHSYRMIHCWRGVISTEQRLHSPMVCPFGLEKFCCCDLFRILGALEVTKIQIERARPVGSLKSSQKNSNLNCRSLSALTIY